MALYTLLLLTHLGKIMLSKIKFIYLTTIVCCLTTAAANANSQDKDDEAQIRQTVSNIATAFNTNDSKLAIEQFAQDNALFWMLKKGEGHNYNSVPFKPLTHTASGMAKFLNHFKENSMSIAQNFQSIDIQFVDSGMALVKTSYEAFRENKISHKGVEYYSLVSTDSGWKIISIMFTFDPVKHG